MTDYQLGSLGQAWVGLLAPLLTGVLYFATSYTTPTKRLRYSAHSAALVLSYVYALAISPWSSGENWTTFIWPFHALFAVFLGGAVYTLVRFDGSKLVHTIQLLQLPSAAFLWFVGGMTITHDWI